VAHAWQAEVSIVGSLAQPVAHVNVNRLPTSRGIPIVLNVVLIDTFTSSRKRRVPYPTNGRCSQGVKDGRGRLLQKGYQGLSVREAAVGPPTTSIGDTAGITPSTC